MTETEKFKKTLDKYKDFFRCMERKNNVKMISDLTKDTRPTPETVLTESIHDIIEIDKAKPNIDGDTVECKYALS